MSKCRTADKLPSQREDPLEKLPQVVKSEGILFGLCLQRSSRIIKFKQALSKDKAKAVSALKSLLQKSKKKSWLLMALGFQ